MATFSPSLSSHRLLGLGFSECGFRSWQRKCDQAAARMTPFGVESRPRQAAVVRNANTPSEDSVGPTRVRISGSDGPKPGSASQINSLTAQQVGTTTELGAILDDEGRPKLLRKLSEANQYIRHLQHELQFKDDALLDATSELSAMEMELKAITWPQDLKLPTAFMRTHLQDASALVQIAEEIGRQGVKRSTRKINGRSIHSHLALRLEEMQKALHERIKDADKVQTRSIDLVYYGKAKDVRVMGSFDGWTRGEQMSPESTGTFTEFTATIELRPGRYEIKFLVDGEWQMSRDLPTVGEGLTMNNLLVVDQI